MKKVVFIDFELDVLLKKSKKDEKKENKGRKKKFIKDIEFIDVDFEFEGDLIGKKNEKKDKKIIKKGEKKDVKKNIVFFESEFDLGVNKKKIKIKEIVSFSDLIFDLYFKVGRRKNVRCLDFEFEDLLGFRVLKLIDDLEVLFIDFKMGMLGMRRGFRLLFKKIIFNERGKRSVIGRIFLLRERLFFFFCEFFRVLFKFVYVCKCKEFLFLKVRYVFLVCLLIINIQDKLDFEVN